ncbi:MAG: ATP-binding protein [Candidatus Diapherotrites archaeon]
MFIDRVKELNTLDELFKENKPRLIILYGRRRVGKSELIKEFAKKHNGLYILAREESAHLQLDNISKKCAEFFNDKILSIRGFADWDQVFSYLEQKIKENHCPVFFDEFPFFVESTPGLPSILQDYWDNKFQQLPCFFVLCGSSISMMEKLMGYKSPIYGRRTHQMLLEPFNFQNASQFFPKKMQVEQKMEFYSVLGGTPSYLLNFDYSKTLFENISDYLLQEESFLYRDVLFVLREELNEPRNYFSILASIAKGNTTIGSIMNDSGLNKGIVNKYLRVLIDLHLIERKVPITERKEKSRKGIYLLRDNFFKFWFKFIFENTDLIEAKRGKNVIEEKIKPEFNAFVGRIFENICSEWLNQNKEYQQYLFGSWWHKDAEIDIVGLNKSKKEILFAECKWRNEKVKINELVKLEEKAKFVKWNNEKRKEFFVFFSKKGFDAKAKKYAEKRNWKLYDLKDLKKIFK